MALIEDLTFKVDNLSYKIYEHDEKQTRATSIMQSEIKDLHSRFVKLREAAVQREKDQAAKPPDDTWTRMATWEITNCKSRFEKMQKNDSIYSPEFTVLGFQGLKLEFFSKRP